MGEWGAPINDIHGSMSEEQQAAWIGVAFERLIAKPGTKRYGHLSLKAKQVTEIDLFAKIPAAAFAWLQRALC